MIRTTRTIEVETEKSIITGLIVSTDFIRAVIDMIDHKYWQTSYATIVARWVLDYFKRYREAPAIRIQDIYAIEKEKLKDVDAQLVSEFLIQLSKQYEEQQEISINVEFLTKRTVDYFRERSLSLLADKVSSYISIGNVDDAEKSVRNYRQVAKKLSEWHDLSDPKYLEKIYRSSFMDYDEEKSSFLFKFPGKLGEFLGPFERDWLIAFLGPMKRGKSFFLIETAFQAFLSNKNVVVVSLEMNAESIASRFLRRLSTKGAYSGQHVYPCFDCFRNQIGKCSMPQRRNYTSLVANDQKPKFTPELEYRVCTYCRDNDLEHYIPATWFESVDKQRITYSHIKEDVTGLITFYGNRLKWQAYPMYTANLSRVMSDLDKLYYTDGFLADVIIIDYADILAPEDDRVIGRDRYDQTWKTLKQLAEEKHCLVVTASQANKSTMKKKNVHQEDVAEDIRKLAHVDAMFSLNQTPKEKDQGIMRIGTLAHRWRDFSVEKQVMVLQYLKDAQVVLDSELIRYVNPDDIAAEE